MARKPFVVIDAEILNSSIWSESASTRMVWLTLLILCDTEGYVGAALPGLARAAGVSIDECAEALDKFLAPDPHSRTKDNDGRRIEVVDRGWRVLNFKSALDRLALDRKNARDRMRRWRAHGWKGKAETLKYPSVGDACPCCSKPFDTPLKLYVHLDHDHGTGMPRDYICVSCNTNVGMVENGRKLPSPAVEAYLRRHGVTVTSDSVTPARPGNREQGPENREQGRTNGNGSSNQARAREAPNPDGPKPNPFIKPGERPKWEAEALNLTERIATMLDLDGVEVFQKASGYTGARTSKCNPANLTEDRLVNTVTDLRKMLKQAQERVADKERRGNV